VWPKAIAPYQVYLISIKGAESEAEKLYEELQSAGVEVLYDDRDERPGGKFADADLTGIPVRVVISSRTLENKEVEWKERNQSDVEMVSLDSLLEKVSNYYS